jgi:urease accessory protein
LVLDHEERRSTRGRVTLSDGREAVLRLSRGTVLSAGDYLSSPEGVLVRVEDALEDLMEIASKDSCQLAELAWHLGNRHAPVMIEGHKLYFLPDPALIALVRSLEFSVMRLKAPFHPLTLSNCHAHTHGHDNFQTPELGSEKRGKLGTSNV